MLSAAGESLEAVEIARLVQQAAAEAVSKYILVDMFAKACTGTLSPAESVKWAAKEYEQIAKKRRG